MHSAERKKTVLDRYPSTIPPMNSITQESAYALPHEDPGCGLLGSKTAAAGSLDHLNVLVGRQRLGIARYPLLGHRPNGKRCVIALLILEVVPQGALGPYPGRGSPSPRIR